MTPYELRKKNPSGYNNDPSLFRDYTFIFDNETDFAEEIEEGDLSVGCGFEGDDGCDPLPIPDWLADLIDEVATEQFDDYEIDTDNDGYILMAADGLTVESARAFFDAVTSAVAEAVNR